MIAARRRGPTPCEGGSPLFPDRKLRISPISCSTKLANATAAYDAKKIEFQKYHIDERRQYRSTRLYRVADRNAIPAHSVLVNADGAMTVAAGVTATGAATTGAGESMPGR